MSSTTVSLPPLPLPLLTTHTNLFYNLPPSPKLLANEPLRYCPSSRPKHASSSAVEKVANGVPRQTEVCESLFLPEAVDSDDEVKIAKPEGEVGRPGRGGYNLEKKLGWDSKSFARLKKRVHHLVDMHLDTEKSIAKQPLALLHLVCESAAELYPRLDEYKGRWPVMDLIKMRLKYTSVRSRRQQEKMALGRTRT